jgi:hypothetical protein
LIVVLPDDLDDGDLGCYGNRAHPTPNLNRPAARGGDSPATSAPAACALPCARA